MTKGQEMFAGKLHEAQTPRGVKRRQIFLVIGGVILIGGISLGAWLLTMRPAPPRVAYSAPTPPVPLPPNYQTLVEEQIAQGLHLRVAQVKNKLQDPSGQGLSGIAAAQGINQDHLYTITISAFQNTSDQMVSTGQWTQQQGNTDMQYWRQRSQKSLIGDVTGWFLNG